MVKVRPWYPANRVYGLTDDMRDLYYTGLWHMDDDFTSYHPQTGERLRGLAARNHRVLWADGLPWKGVAPLLLRDLEVGESCTLTYDYKVIAGSRDDHLNCFVNDVLRLASDYTYGWLRASHSIGGDGLSLARNAVELIDSNTMIIDVMLPYVRRRPSSTTSG